MVEQQRPVPRGGFRIRSSTLRGAISAALVLAMALAAPTSGQGAQPAAGPPTLDIRPGGGPQRSGLPHTLEAEVALPNGDGVDGVVVDFELTTGPGDDDIGTSGHTPDAPDMSCTTAGGSPNHAASCTVEYTDLDNAGGSDAVLAWIDADGLDATVEADLEEGANQHAPGSGGCDVDSKGPGLSPEPDQTDCVEKRWIALAPATVDLEAESASAQVGTSGTIEAGVYDQFGDLLTGAGNSTTVSLELLAGSAHDPGDGSDFGSPDLGSCDTGTTGRCKLEFGSSVPGLDLLCGYVPGESASCSEGIGASERADGADVVQRVWVASTPPPPPDPPAPDPSPPAPSPPAPDVTAAVAPPAAVSPPPAKPSPSQPAAKRSRETPAHTPPETAPPADDPVTGAQPITAAPVARRAVDAQTRAGSRPASAPRRRTARRAGGTAGRHRAAAARRRAAAAVGRPAPSERAGRNRRGAGQDAGGRARRRLRELSQVAVKTAKRYSFPLSLALFVFAFMVVQGRIDRRDPKLRLAPLDSKHDLATFA